MARKAPSAPTYKSLDTAPFIYFDVVPTYGVQDQAVQIEIAALARTPVATGTGVINEFITTARLRCGPAAALQLQQSIAKALAMLQEKPDAGTPIN